MVLTKQLKRSCNSHDNLIKLSSIVVYPINFEIVCNILKKLVQFSTGMFHNIFNVLCIEIFFCEWTVHNRMFVFIYINFLIERMNLQFTAKKISFN